MSKRFAQRQCGALSLPFGLVVGLALATGCQSKSKQETESSARAVPSGQPVDHLAPNELAPSTDIVFGLALPEGMHLDWRFPDSAHAKGTLSVEAVTRYLQNRVQVAHVELAPGKTIFPRARIKGQSAAHVYDLEVSRAEGETRLLVRDVTPKQAPAGLSEEERWRRAGLTKTGELVDKNKLR